MPTAETTETPVISLSRQDSNDLAMLARALVDHLGHNGPIAKQLDHMDVQLHEAGQRLAALAGQIDALYGKAEAIERFLEEQKPNIDRATALLDPGALVRRAMPGRHRPPRGG